MSPFISLGLEIIAVAAAFALTNLAILALRNPRRDTLLKRHSVSELISGFVVLAVLISLSYLGLGVFTALPGLAVGGLVFVGTTIVLYIAIERAMGMAARLQACDEGRSPFDGNGKIPAAGTPV